MVEAHAEREGFPPESPRFGLRLPTTSLYQRQSLVGFLTTTEFPGICLKLSAFSCQERLSVITFARACPLQEYTARILDFLFPFIGDSSTHLFQTAITEEVCLARAFCSDFFLKSGHVRRQAFLHIWTAEMQAFREALASASQGGQFTLPPDFLYQEMSIY